VSLHRGLLAPVHDRNGGARGKCGRGSPPPAVRVSSGGHALEKFWNFRCNFLLSGTLSARKLTSVKAQNIQHLHSRLYCMYPPSMRNWNNGTTVTHPGQDYNRMWERGASKRDVLAKTGLVAVLSVMCDCVNGRVLTKKLLKLQSLADSVAPSSPLQPSTCLIVGCQQHLTHDVCFTVLWCCRRGSGNGIWSVESLTSSILRRFSREIFGDLVPSHPIDNIWAMMMVRKIRWNVIRTVLCWIVCDSCAQWYTCKTDRHPFNTLGKPAPERLNHSGF